MNKHASTSDHSAMKSNSNDGMARSVWYVTLTTIIYTDVFCECRYTYALNMYRYATHGSRHEHTLRYCEAYRVPISMTFRLSRAPGDSPSAWCKLVPGRKDMYQRLATMLEQFCTKDKTHTPAAKLGMLRRARWHWTYSDKENPSNMSQRHPLESASKENPTTSSKTCTHSSSLDQIEDGAQSGSVPPGTLIQRYRCLVLFSSPPIMKLFQNP